MLSSILAKSDCAACKFCCSFRRTSLWETPIFTAADVEKLKELYPHAKFREVNAAGCAESSGNSKNPIPAYTFDISDQYQTTDPAEEAPCPFLDPSRGCILPPELKPFDCKIWPLRAVRTSDNKIKVALTPTCPAINKVPIDRVRNLAASGLGDTILDYAEKHPEIIKEQTPFLSNIIFEK